MIGRGFTQGQHRADHHADQDVGEAAAERAAEALHHARMFAQPDDEIAAQRFGIAGQRLDDPRRQAAARVVDRFSQPFEQRRHAVGAIAKEVADPEHGRRQQTDDDDGQQRDGNQLGRLATQRGHTQACSQQVHEFIDQQAGKQRRQQVQVEHGHHGGDSGEQRKGVSPAEARTVDSRIHGAS